MPSSPWSSRREVSPETARLLIERAHAEFIAGDAQNRRLADVRSLVRDSWFRARDGAVDADGMPVIDLSGDALEEYRRTHPLAGVIGMIRGLLLPGSAEDAGVAVAVGDAAGRLLWVEGDHRIRRRTGDMGFVAGADWSEASVGTSAPGTAIALGSSVQIHGAEHFNHHVQSWSCTAAPVRDPETRRIIGMIDVTGSAETITPQTQLLVDATARAVEGELLVSRLRARDAPAPRRRRTAPTAHRTTLRVLGRERPRLEVQGDTGAVITEISPRHAEILLLLVLHPAGLGADRLAELIYGDGADSATLRPEIVRLRKALARTTGDIELASRPYRLTGSLESDAHSLLSLLDRGAHRVALAAYAGDVLPGSDAPGVVAFRDTVRATLRESLVSEAGVDVLLAFADTEGGADDRELLVLILEQLPARSPKRAGIVARIEALDAAD